MYKVKCKIYSHKKEEYVWKNVYVRDLADVELIQKSENSFGQVVSFKELKVGFADDALEKLMGIWADNGGGR